MKNILFVAIASSLLFGQRIETLSPDSTRIVHVATALNHLTVIEVGEPVVMAAAGSKAFTVERKDDKVFVQPQEENATTNLFIWTASHRRYTYELETCPNVGQAEFAVDYASPVSNKTATVTTQPQPNSIEELLLEGTSVRFVGLKKPQLLSGRVGIQIHDIYKDRANRELLIRYSVQNGSRTAYRPGPPAIVLLPEVNVPFSLWSYRDSQIDGKLVRNLPVKNAGANLIATQVRTPQSLVAPGQTSFGVLKVGFPDLAGNNPAPRVVRFLFPADDGGQVIATLVL
ncbi:MAG: TrbG/VirB9 family P-type conjugative transfer protein [Bryobacteraceae bacterium]